MRNVQNIDKNDTDKTKFLNYKEAKVLQTIFPLTTWRTAILQLQPGYHYAQNSPIITIYVLSQVSDITPTPLWLFRYGP